MSQWLSQKEPVQIKVQRTYKFSVGDRFELSGIQFTPPKRTRHIQVKKFNFFNYKLQIKKTTDTKLQRILAVNIYIAIGNILLKDTFVAFRLS